MSISSSRIRWAPHPNGYYRTFTFDTKSGAALELGDLFAPGASYLDTLSRIARAKLPAQIATAENVSVSEVDTHFHHQGTVPEEDSFQNFYLEGSNLVIIFPSYQVGPYVLGVVSLTIRGATLKAS